jgi:two-component system sensor histidine kinase ResE
VFLFKSVVGKLWLTIIGLVVVVLLILSLFLGRFIDSIFANSKDQKLGLERLVGKIAIEMSLHKDEAAYISMVNELLEAQDAKLIYVRPDHRETSDFGEANNIAPIGVERMFAPGDLDRAFTGAIVTGHFTVSTAGFGKSEFISVAAPIRDPAAATGLSGVAVLYQSQQTLEYTQWHVKLLFFFVSLLGFTMTTVFAFFLSTRITRPLRQLKKAADLISVGEYETRVTVHSSDEIGELAKTFNHMARELKQNIEALNDEKVHLASVLRSMSDAVITFDVDGNVNLSNPQGQKIIEDWSRIGWGEKADPELSDRISDDENPDRPDRLPEPLRPLFEQVLGDGSEHTSRVHVMDGVWSVVMAPLYSSELVRGTVTVLRDVTEEFRLDKLRRDFVANVSHELRTPLSMLHGYSEALIDDIAVSPEEHREMVQIIYDESLRMERLVSDLLDLARMEAGHTQLNLGMVDLNLLLQRIHRKFNVFAKENGIELLCQLPRREIVLDQVDEDRLEQVLTNLLDNAIRHTQRGASITVSASVETVDMHAYAKLQVADQGSGIPTEDLPYIFERFYKADKARTRGKAGSSGTGLGLSIVKNIIDAHKGKVFAASTPGKGTTFTILLPMPPKYYV